MSAVVAVYVLVILVAVGIPAGVWFGIRIGEMRADDWWERMLSGDDRPAATTVQMLLSVRKVTR